MSPVTRRRFTLQLAPLLDLLFIVLYAQYIDLQQAASREVAQEAILRQEAQLSEKEAGKLRQDALEHVADLTRQVQQAEIEKRRLNRELELARAETEKEGQAREEMERMAARDRQVIGQLVKDVLKIDESFLADALRGATQPDRQRLQASFEQMKAKSASSVIHHLRTTEELKKRADLWEIYIADDNSVQVTLVGEKVADGLQVRGPDQVANALAELARQRGEPKSLVIVLLSWSDADRRTREFVRQGVERLVTVLKAEWPGKRIDIAPLGYTPTPP